MIQFEGYIFSVHGDTFCIDDKLGNKYTLHKKFFTKAINKLLEDSHVKSNTDPSVEFISMLVFEMETHFGKGCLQSYKKKTKKQCEARALFNYIVLQKLGNNNLTRNLIQQQTNQDRTNIYYYEMNLKNKIHLTDIRIYHGDYVCNWFWRIKSKIEGIDFSHKLKTVTVNKVYENKIKEQFDKHKFQFLDAFSSRNDYVAIKSYLKKVPKKEIVEVLINHDPDFKEIMLKRKNGR